MPQARTSVPKCDERGADGTGRRYAAAVRALAAWLPAIVIAAVIFTLSAQANLRVTEGLLDLVLRKLAHTVVFGLLAAACFRGLTSHGVTGRTALTAAACLATAYAISDEFHQTFVHGRHGTPVDWAIDTAGAALASARLARRREPSEAKP